MAAPNINNPYLPIVIQIPSALTITAITRAFPMVVTVSANSQQSDTYIAGQNVRFNIPISYKMWQLNGQILTINSVSGSTLTFAIDSTLFDPFIIPASGEQQPATLAPSGSRNLQYNNTTGQVPFQSLDNQGN